MDGKLLLQEIRGRPIDLVPGKKVVSVNPGEWTSPFEGKGFEARGYRDYEIGDNPRQIHLPTSARRGVPTIVERVALRDVKLMVVIDLTPSMAVRQKLVIQHEAAALMLYAGWQAETTFALAARTGAGVHSFGLGIGSRHFYRSFRILWQLLAGHRDDVPVGSNVHLRRCLPPSSMLVYCSDYLDPGPDADSIDKLLRAAGRYDFVPVVIQDELEFSFPKPARGSLIACGDPTSGADRELWVSTRTAARIARAHEARFEALVEQFRRRDVRHVHLGEPGVDRAHAAISSFFRRRRRQAA